MEPYTFHEGPLPDGTALDYEEALFNLPAFAAAGQRHCPPSISYYLMGQRRKKAIAGIHFQLSAHQALSPFKAPFGSVECSEHIEPKRLYRFLEAMETNLKDKGITEIRIKNPPRAYAPAKLALMEIFFLNQKYVITHAEAGAVITVTQKRFVDIIRHSEKLRVRQAHNAGFVFHQAGLHHFPEVFDFISGCHREKGYGLSITADELYRTARAFPGRYLLFVVREQEKIRAAAISIRINSKILYNFLANHNKECNNLSPAVMLMEGIYDHCRDNGFELLDLGTSALQDKPNFTLLDFKMHIGATPTSKLSFCKSIA